MKDFLGWKWFSNDEELKKAATTWLKMFAAEEYNMVIEKQVPLYNKCLDNHYDYVE